MPTEQRSKPSERSEDGLERLLREFYVAEMPPALIHGTEAPDGPVRQAGAGNSPDPGRSGGRTLGLTAVLASLMLMASALVWAPRRERSPETNVSRAAEAGHAPHDERQPGGPAAAESPSRGPVEFRGRTEDGIPVDVPGGDEAGEGGDRFPELDIRILPIEDAPKQ